LKVLAGDVVRLTLLCSEFALFDVVVLEGFENSDAADVVVLDLLALFFVNMRCPFSIQDCFYEKGIFKRKNKKKINGQEVFTKKGG